MLDLLCGFLTELILSSDPDAGHVVQFFDRTDSFI